MDYRSAESAWAARPGVGRAIRVAIAAAPFGLALGAARWLPPARLGVSRWLWAASLGVFNTGVLVCVDRFG